MMNERLHPIGLSIADYLGQHWATHCELVDIEQIPGGASRETYLVRITRNAQPLGLVLRRDPPSSLIDTQRSHEYRTYQAVFKHGVVPVPEPIALEEDNPGDLERPFSVMTLVEHGQAGIAGLDEPEMASKLAGLGEQKWTMLGNLAKTPLTALGVSDFMATPKHPAQHELEYWRNVIKADALHAQPIAAVALRWLENNLPAPSKHLCLVHGDYRSGNFMYTPDGEITAILDWEMAHIGDPLEDLAWSLDPLWSDDKHIAGRLLPRQQAIDIWQQASGIKVDRQIFKWWQIFASVKGLAIWISSAQDYVMGTTKEPILAYAGWPMIDRQNRILLDRLSPETEHSYAEPLL